MLADITKKTSIKIQLSAAVVLLAIAAVGIASTTIHTIQDRILTAGVDTYQYHRPIFGQQSAAQDIAVEHELRGIGAILVNLRRVEELADVTVTLVDPLTDAVLEQAVIPAEQIIDDTFATIALRQPISARRHDRIRVIFTAPTATSQGPVGIRFHPDDPYPFSDRLESGQVTTGDLALVLQERLRLGEYVYRTLRQSRQLPSTLGALALATLVALLAARLGWRQLATAKQHWLELSILAGIALLAFGLRAAWLPSFYGVSGGDPYNYLLITQQLANLANPFEISKRLPGFPLLLLPAYLTAIDDIWWMRLMSITSASLSVFLTGLLARRLRLPWAVQVIAASLLVWHKDFWWTSFRPEAYSFYGMLLLLALVLFFNLAKNRNKILFGLLIGYAAMTRQEGFVLAAVLLVATIVFWRQLFDMPAATRQWRAWLPLGQEWRIVAKNVAFLYLPAGLLVAPFFLHNALTYGNPLYTQYFAGDRLQIVDSVNAFFDSTAATWGVLGSMWRTQWGILYRIPLTLPVFIGSALLTCLWWFISFTAFYRRATSLRVGLGVVWVLLLGTTIWLMNTHPGVLYENVMVVSAAVLVVSAIPLLAATTWRGLIIIAVAVSQILIALWFHPFAKHYQQAYPLLVLALAAAVAPSVGRRFIKHRASTGARFLLGLSRASLLTPLLLVPIALWQSQVAFIDKYNRAVALDNVVYRATQFARTQPGPHGADQPYLPVHLYFSGTAHYFLGDEPHTPAQALAWLKERGVKTLIDTNNNAAFKNPPADWQILEKFRAEGKDEFIYESRVYRIP